MEISITNRTKLETIKSDILKSVTNSMSVHGLRNPLIGKGGEDYTWCYAKDFSWTNPFFAGQLWLSYILTGKEDYKNLARTRYEHFKQILEVPTWINHDLGFEFSLTAVADYKLTGNKEARELALRAASSLRSRYNVNGKYIVAWTAGKSGQKHAEQVQGKIIIDCMQNLALLLWAFNQTANQSFKDIAIAQAETTLKYIVRDDFSTYHSFDFNTTTNKPIGGKTVQGFADESCWSRGQSWAIHGYAQMALSTDNQEYTNTSMKLADYAIAKMEEKNDFVPVWDYLLPKDEIQYKDTSAGSVTSAGLFLLAEVLENSNRIQEAEKYFKYGLKILYALRDKHDLTGNPSACGLLSEGASFVPEAQQNKDPKSANAMLPYGDYYYYEAVLRALGHNKFFW